MAFLPPSTNDIANLLSLAEVLTDPKKLKEAALSMQAQLSEVAAVRDETSAKLIEIAKLGAELDKRAVAVQESEKALSIKIAHHEERAAQLEAAEEVLSKKQAEVLKEQAVLKAEVSALASREKSIVSKAEANAEKAEELSRKIEEAEQLRVSYEQKIAALKALAG